MSLDPTLLLHFESSSVLDSSFPAKTITANGSVATATTLPKFGTRSCVFSGGYLSISDLALKIGTQDFTISFWANMSSISGTTFFLDTRDSGSTDSGFNIFSDSGEFRWSDSLGNSSPAITAGAVVINAWNHFEIGRASGTFYTFLNGVLISTVTGITTDYQSQTWTMGAGQYYPPGVAPMSGYMDEFRAIIGECEHTSDFTVPTTAYGDIGTVLFLDTFHDTNGTLITAHTPDVAPTGAWVYDTLGGTSTNALSIQSNKLVTSGTVDGVHRLRATYPTEFVLTRPYKIRFKACVATGGNGAYAYFGQGNSDTSQPNIIYVQLGEDYLSITVIDAEYNEFDDNVYTGITAGTVYEISVLFDHTGFTTTINGVDRTKVLCNVPLELISTNLYKGSATATTSYINEISLLEYADGYLTGDGLPPVDLSIPINTCDIILENPLRSRFVRPPSTFSSATPPYINLYPTPANPAVSALTHTVSDTIFDSFGVPANLYIPSTTNTLHYIGWGVGTYTLDSGQLSVLGVYQPQSHQTEIYVKDDGSHHGVMISMRASNVADTVNNRLDATFSPLTGTTITPTVVGPNWSDTFLSIASVGTGWWKVVLGGTYTPSTGDSMLSSAYFILDSSNASSYAGDGTTGLFMYAPQLYVNSTPDEVIGDSYTDVDANTWYWNGYAWYLSALTAKTIRLVTSGQTFSFDSGGALDPSTQFIRLDVLKQNTTAACDWTTSPSIDLYDSTAGGSPVTSGNTVYIRSADFGTLTSVAITATVVDLAQTLVDSTKVIRIQDGGGYTQFLTNEVALIPASSDGIKYILYDNGGVYKVYADLFDSTGDGAYGIDTIGNMSATQNGLTIYIDTVAPGTYFVNGDGWTTDSESFNLLETFGGSTVTTVFTIAKIKAVPKITVIPQAVAVTLSRDSASVLCDTSGTPVSYTGTGTDILVYEGSTFYTYTTGTPATGQFNLSGSIASGITMGSVTASSSGNNRAIVANASTMTADTADITFNINIKTLAGADIILSKIMTITKSIPPDTSGAVSVTLTKDNATVLCDATGTPVSYAGTAVDVAVYQGTTFYTYVSGTPTPGQFSLSGSVASGITMGSITASSSGIDRAIIAAASAITTDPATITLNIVIKTLSGSDLTLSKVINITKAIPLARSSVITSIDITSATAWSDTSAATALTNIGMGTPIPGDIVTEYNGTAGFAETRVRTSSATWIALTNLISGGAIVPNTLPPVTSSAASGSGSSSTATGSAVTEVNSGIIDMITSVTNVGKPILVNYNVNCTSASQENHSVRFTVTPYLNGSPISIAGGYVPIAKDDNENSVTLGYNWYAQKNINLTFYLSASTPGVNTYQVYVLAEYLGGGGGTFSAANTTLEIDGICSVVEFLS